VPAVTLVAGHPVPPRWSSSGAQRPSAPAQILPSPGSRCGNPFGPSTPSGSHWTWPQSRTWCIPHRELRLGGEVVYPWDHAGTASTSGSPAATARLVFLGILLLVRPMEDPGGPGAGSASTGRGHLDGPRRGSAQCRDASRAEAVDRADRAGLDRPVGAGPPGPRGVARPPSPKRRSSSSSSRCSRPGFPGGAPAAPRRPRPPPQPLMGARARAPHPQSQVKDLPAPRVARPAEGERGRPLRVTRAPPSRGVVFARPSRGGRDGS
jgi:hypothetical protein